jgi:MerR family transcriptional regulator/heat shock protein HspR
MGPRAKDQPAKASPATDEPRPSPLDDTAEPFYTIGQVSSLLDLPQATLRRLEDHQLVTPGRSEGGQRRYSRDDMDRIEEVRNLTDEGLTLPGVRKVLDLRQRITDLEHEIGGLRDQQGDSAE